VALGSDREEEQSAGQRLRAMRQHVSTGGGKSEAIAYLLEALVEAGVPLMLILTTLLYSAQLSDYRVGKAAVIHIAVPILLSVWLIRQVIQKQLRVEWSPLYLPFLVYFLVSTLSLTFSINAVQGGEVLLFQVWCFLFYVLVCHHFRDPTVAAGVLWAVVLAGFIVALLGLLQYNGLHVLFHPHPQTNLPISTLGNPNFVAHYLEIIIPLTVVLLLVRQRTWERGALVLAFVVTASHMVLTGSRAGWLATGIALLFLLYKRQWHIRWISGIVPVAVIGILLSPTVGLVLNNVHLGQRENLYDSWSRIAERTWERMGSSFDRDDHSISQRRIIWSDTWELIKDQPWLGVGPGNYELALPAYRTIEQHRNWKKLMGQRTHVPYHAHNEYLEFWSESGIIGLLSILWLFGTLLWTGHTYLNERPPDVVRTITLGCIAAMMATLVHGIFSFNLQDPTSASHFWLLGGLVVAVNRGEGGTTRLSLDIALSTRLRLVLPVAFSVLLVSVGLYMGLSILCGDVHYVQGRTKAERDGHPNRAILAFREAVKWRSWDYSYYHSLGLTSLRVRRFAEAAEALARAVELHPHNAPALRLWAEALLGQGKAVEAEVAVRRAIDLEPLKPDNYAWLARIYGKQGEHERAIKAWEQALAFDSEEHDYLREIGQAYYEVGRVEEAVTVLEQVVHTWSNDGLAQGNLGVIYFHLGRLAEADMAFGKAANLRPGDVQWWKYLAVVYLDQQRWDEALPPAKRALQLTPQDVQLQEIIKKIEQRLQEGRE